METFTFTYDEKIIIAELIVEISRYLCHGCAPELGKGKKFALISKVHEEMQAQAKAYNQHCAEHMRCSAWIYDPSNDIIQHRTGSDRMHIFACDRVATVNLFSPSFQSGVSPFCSLVITANTLNLSLHKETLRSRADRFDHALEIFDMANCSVESVAKFLLEIQHLHPEGFFPALAQWVG